MKRIIVLFLLVAALSRSLYAFSLSVGSNRVKVSQTSTVTVGDISGSPTSYEWSADIGSISGSGASVTYTAPAVKGKATISVTVKNGTTTLWSGTVQILVYKSIIVIKTDDYSVCEWSPWTDHERPNWTAYLDYMQNDAKVKTSFGLICNYLTPDPSKSPPRDAAMIDITVNKMKSRIDSGYMEIYNHSYTHDCQATKDEATMTAELANCENLVFTKVGVHLRGFGPPGACSPNVSANTVAALNNAPEMKYVYSLNASADTLSPNIFHFTDANHRLDCEGSGFVISLAQFQSQYAAKKDRAVNFVQLHPSEWDTEEAGNDIAQWKLIIAYMKTEGVTVIFPYEYVRMLNEPAFVPDEAAPPDTTAPIISAEAADNLPITGCVRITWTTNEPATSQVEYGTDTNYGTSYPSTPDTSKMTSHQVDLTGLTPGTLYHYRAKSTDTEDNPAIGTDQTFTTTNTGGGDTTAPGAPAAVRDGTGTSDIATTNSTTQLSANWDAAVDNESAISAYWYAIGTSAGATNTTGAFINNGTTMSVTKTGTYLVGQTYYFTVKAASAGGTGPVRNSDGQLVTTVPDTTTPSTTYPNPFSLSRPGGMTFVVSAQAQGELKIYTMNGKLIKTLTGTNTISWDGTNEDNEKVARGIYIYTIKDETGNKTGKISVTK